MDRTTTSELQGPPPVDRDVSERLLFERYETGARFFDEMFESPQQPRAHYRMLIDEMRRMPQDEVERLQDRVTRSFLHEGITFTVYGDQASIERAFPIDCVPRLLLAREWAHIEGGLVQRVQALNLFLSDVYHKGHILRDGTVPRDLVESCPNYRPEMKGVHVPLGAYVSVCGSDVVRTADGFMVLEDNLRVPSGVSYMLPGGNPPRLSADFPALPRAAGRTLRAGTPADAPCPVPAAGGGTDHCPADARSLQLRLL